MTSFIIVSKEKEKRIAYAKQFCSEKQIAVIDISLIEKDLTAKQATQSIGIEEIKKIQKTVFLKPIKSPLKAVIIEDAHLLTPEAQNALLKVLEEPPANTILMLGTKSKEALLPTIHSRCQIIVLEETALAITEKEQKELQFFLTHLAKMSLSERLKAAEQNSKDKEKAIIWIEKLILVQRDLLLAAPEDYFGVLILRQLQALYTTIRTTNVNPRFAIESTLLSFE